ADLRRTPPAQRPGRVRQALQPATTHRSRQLHPPRPDHPAADLSQERIRRDPSSAASPANTNEPRRRPGQYPRPTAGTPQAELGWLARIPGEL
ncbi:MAG TPA: hypothetical protein VN961_20600, partial [Streptosporangiaceae bacterium]|nr:hypothetical protein [Streptosporangiaceae bacterium]